MIPFSRPHPQARYLAPEVVQTSAMDCGPASLQSLLEGFGLSVSYGRLREACQTSVDGTSISTMDELANLLGLDTEEKLLPVDHLLLSGASPLPAIVVVRNPDGNTHFVVVWSISGPWIQVMDPAQGRQWVLRSALLDRLYVHTLDLPASQWRSWVGEQEFLGALDLRLAALEVAKPDRNRLYTTALADPGWHAMAELDAATRLTASMVRTGAISRGAACLALIEHQVERAHGDDSLPLDEYRSVRRARVQGDEEMVTVRGAVLVHARGIRAHRTGPGDLGASDDSEASVVPCFPPELAAVLTKNDVSPERTLLRMLCADGLLAPAVLGVVLAISAALVTVNIIVLRGLLELGEQLHLPSQRAAAFAGIIGVLVLGLLVELPLISGALRLGRRLDLRLRLAFLTKIPRLEDQYFRSRLASDMAERGHSLHVVRTLPQLGVRMLTASAQLLFTVAGIAWLQPAAAPLALLTAVVCIGLPVTCQPIMAEREFRVRNHAGALGRFYLDALLGLLPIRVHGARSAMQRRQENLLVHWARASLSFHASSTLIEGTLALCGLGTAVFMVWSFSSHTASGMLLLVYWALSLPALGQEIALVARQYPMLRNVVARLLEPLGTPEQVDSSPAVAADGDPPARAVAIRMSDVFVEAGGHTVLSNVELAIAPGEHVAIVGASGAGKSSLVGLLLGWYRPGRGTVEIDGVPLTGTALSLLRRDTAWIDPAVTLWNCSFLDNLRYGALEGHEFPLADILAQARLREVLEHLPQGLATELGEGGSMVSGGEGQRARVGRMLARKRARLVILDEPFRGLDLTMRRELMANVRRWWSDATLLWVTHDIAETESFGRVLVIDAGRIVENGSPADLARRTDSRYAQLLRGDREMHRSEWSGTKWRQIWLADGRLREERDP